MTTQPPHPPGATLHLGGNAWAYPALKPLLRPATEYTAHPDNPNDGDIEAVIESMQVNGIYRPVYVDEHTGYAMGGNTTGAAMLELGATRIPLLRIPADEATRLRILSADNEVARRGRINPERMMALLEQVRVQTETYTGTGFTEESVAELERALNINFDPLPTGRDAALDSLDPRPCPKCGYDTANDPERLRVPR